MSKYTTGEMAKLCGVSVRTVQYYDTRGILVPNELSEGGRRLYSDDDLKKLRIICFLREIGLPINSIGELLSEDDPGSVVSLLLSQQEKVLKEEIAERQTKLRTLEGLQRELKSVEHFSIESIADIAHVMENRKKLRKTRAVLLAVGLVLDIIEAAALVLWIVKGIWQAFAIGMCVVAVGAILVSSYYIRRVVYICPRCHNVFRPAVRQILFARHTPKARKLTCTECGHKGFCVETYGGEENK